MGLEGLLLHIRGRRTVAWLVAVVVTLVGCTRRSLPGRADDAPKSVSPTNEASTPSAVPHARRPPPIELARRINGDVVMLPLSHTGFNSPENLRSIAVGMPGVEYADVFAVWPVRIAAGNVQVDALLKLQAIDPRIAEDVGLRSRLRGEPTAPPAVALGSALAKTLRVRVADKVLIEVAAGEGTDGAASVGCRVAEVVAYGHELYDRQLIYAELMHRARFRLELTGVELRTSASTDRGALVTRLRGYYGDDVALVPVEELITPPPAPSLAP